MMLKVKEDGPRTYCVANSNEVRITSTFGGRCIWVSQKVSGFLKIVVLPTISSK